MSDRLTGRLDATRSEVLASNGMVATSQPLATQAGLDILKAGGNAVDAAICANACLGLMEPTGCGIGGDLFAIVYEAKSKRLYGLNGSGRSARSSSLDSLKKELARLGEEQIPLLGGLSVSVPGCVDGWFTLHERFGTYAMSDILEPAIRYAEEGFPVSELIAYYWQKTLANRKSESLRHTFSMDGLRGPEKGEIWRNPQLAKVLKQISKDGKTGFYEGETLAEMLKVLQLAGSFLKPDDFKNHSSEWVQPVKTDYRSVELWELPPNGQGIAALQILNILEGFHLENYGFGSWEHIHLFAEAKRLAFADRARLYADPDFSGDGWKNLISKEYADAQRKLVSLDRIMPDPCAFKGPPKNGDTIYLSTADKAGNMVSLIQSNYHGMGSNVAVPQLGFAFQNRGCAFSLDETHPNVYAGGKRPFHTIIPAFLTRKGHPLASFGVMGGATQPQAHAQIVMNLVDFKMNFQEAGDAPRIVHEDTTNLAAGELPPKEEHLAMEKGFSRECHAKLEELGYRISRGEGQFGGYQAIGVNSLPTRVYIGASESRKDGQASGY